MSISVARASRQSIILATVAGLHAALLIVVASGMGSFLIVKAKDTAFTWVTPRPPPPLPLVHPQPVDPAGYVPEKVPAPDVPIPLTTDQSHPEFTLSTPMDSAPGKGPEKTIGYVQPPQLRTLDRRLAALIDACYPAAARRQAEEGRAVARLVIGPDGRVGSWSIEQGSGFARLDAALGCVIGRLEFVPGRRDGRAVEAVVLLPVTFRLD